MALLWKMMCNLGDPMSLHHPVQRGTGAAHNVKYTYIRMLEYSLFYRALLQKRLIISRSREIYIFSSKGGAALH